MAAPPAMCAIFLARRRPRPDRNVAGCHLTTEVRFAIARETMPRVLLTAVALLMGVGAAGCHRRARSVEEAYAQVERAVAARDALALFELCDAATRAAVKGAFHDQQLER